MKKGSIKNNRINGEVMRELSAIISELGDPRIDPFASVMRAEVTPDLQFCKCYISTIGSDESLAKTIEGLKNAEGYIRRELAHRVNLRKTPKLQFVADHSIEYAIEMSQKIEALVREEEAEAAERAEQTEEAAHREEESAE